MTARETTMPDPERPLSRAREQAEEALLETPRPHPGALPPGPGIFANRPFVWLMISFAVSQLGFWAFYLGVVGEAGYRFRATPFQLAVLFSAFSVGFIPLTVPFGMVVDRWSPKLTMLLGTLAAATGVAVALAARSVAWLDVAFFLDGVGAAMAIPARGSLTGLLVEESALVRANGTLNSASMLAVIVGPGVAAVLEAGKRFDPSIYWYALATIAVGGALGLLIPDRRADPAPGPGFAAEIAGGFRVAWLAPELRRLLFLSGAAYLFTTVLVAFEPLFVREVLHRGVDVLGFLWAAHGVGAFAGAAALARSRRASGREVPLIGASLVVAGVGFLAYVGTGSLEVAVAGTAVLGIGFAWYLSLSQALIQRVAAEDLRGRVTGVVGMLQEAAGLGCALLLAAIGTLVTRVQPYLVWSAVALVASGILGLRGARRFRPVTAGPPDADA